MGVVANVTEYSNAVTSDAVLSSLSSPAFVKAAVGLESIYRENLPQGSKVKKFTKNGSLTAASLAESTPLAVDANGEYTESSVSATAAKIAVVSGLSVEAEEFTTLNPNKLIDEQYAGMGRYVSNDIIGMASSLSVVQTSTSVMTVDDLFEAQTSIYNSNCPNQEVMLHAILGPRALKNVRKEMIQSGASAWTNPNMLAILQNLPANGGLMGEIPGLARFYQTTGFATTGGDDQQLIIHPMWCLAGIFGVAPTTWPTRKGSEGFYLELASFYFYDVIEWNDLAGVQLRSDT